MREKITAALIEAGRGVVRKVDARALPQSPRGIMLALFLLALVAICSFLSWQQYVKAADLTRQNNQAISTLNASIVSLLIAETSQRGFLLTGDEQYLEKFSDAVASSKISWPALDASALDAEDKRILFRLKGVVADKLRELTLTLSLARSGHSAEAAKVVKSNRGLQLMRDIRSLGREYDARLQRRLRDTRQESRFYARLSQWVSTFGSCGIFLLVFFANRSNVRLISTITRLNTELTQVNAELQQFVYSASHDLQEPLRTVSIYSELASNKAESGRPFKQDLAYVKASAKHMLQIVDDLQVYTRAASDSDASQPEAADLNEVVTHVCRLLAAAIQETQAKIVCKTLPTLPVSELHARLLLQNLIGNALKYRSASQPPSVNIRVEQRPGRWLLSVSDNGIGIDPQYHARIFGLFKRLHTREEYQGTGLGLAICKKIAERYGGSISVASEVGIGSTFTVVIPAVPCSVVAPETTPVTPRKFDSRGT